MLGTDKKQKVVSDQAFFIKYLYTLPQVQGTFPTDKTQLIWLCAPPVSVEVWGGLMVEGMEFQRRSMRYDMIITVIVLIFLLKVQRDGGELDGCAHHRRPWL